MGKIHQLYCTHCTYGSSALERREGDLADRPLGYSVRAGSADRSDLRRYFRDAERFMYYYLPSDEPAEAKLRHDAASAPRRLFYCPSINNMQLTGQISYRAVDTAGRPGSYFGHVLLWHAGDTEDAALKSLQTWSGRWEDTDSSAIPVTLEPLQDLSELARTGGPAIDDAVLESFLTTPCGGEFNDPQGVVPQRWRDTPVEEREALVKELLQTLINAGSGRRDSLVLAIEPGVAALVFYGVVRLLPPGKLREQVGFSTYEPNPERSLFALAATTFADPLQTDFKPELYRGRSYVRHTWQNKSAASVRADGLYAASILQTLKSDGWAAAASQLADFSEAGISRLEDLERFTGIRASFESLFLSGQPTTELNWKDDLAVRYFRKAAVKVLRTEPGQVLASAQADTYRNYRLWLQLLSFEGAPADIRTETEGLIELWPDLRINELLGWEGVATSIKSLAARRYFQATQFQVTETSPFDSATMWRTEGSSSNAQSSGASPLLVQILRSLSADQRLRLQRIAPRERMPVFLASLVAVWLTDKDVLGSLASSVEQIDPETFRTFIQQNREYLQKHLPPTATWFVLRIQELANGLLLKPQSFSENLEILRPWSTLISTEEDLGKRFSACQALHHEFTTLAAYRASLSKPLSHWLGKSGTSQIPRAKADHLAILFNDAWPIGLDSDSAGSRRTEALVDLAKRFLSSDSPLSLLSVKRIQRFFADGHFQLAAPTAVTRLSGGYSARRIMLGVIVGIFTCLGLIVGVTFWLKEGLQTASNATATGEHSPELPSPPVAPPVAPTSNTAATNVPAKITTVVTPPHSDPLADVISELDKLENEATLSHTDKSTLAASARLLSSATQLETALSKLADNKTIVEAEFTELTTEQSRLFEDYAKQREETSILAARLKDMHSDISNKLDAKEKAFGSIRSKPPTASDTNRAYSKLIATKKKLDDLHMSLSFAEEFSGNFDKTRSAIVENNRLVTSRLPAIVGDDAKPLASTPDVYYHSPLPSEDMFIAFWKRAPASPTYRLLRPSAADNKTVRPLHLITRKDGNGFVITDKSDSVPDKKSEPTTSDIKPQASSLSIEYEKDDRAAQWSYKWTFSSADDKQGFYNAIKTHVLHVSDTNGSTYAFAFFSVHQEGEVTIDNPKQDTDRSPKQAERRLPPELLAMSKLLRPISGQIKIDDLEGAFGKKSGSIKYFKLLPKKTASLKGALMGLSFEDSFFTQAVFIPTSETESGDSFQGKKGRTYEIKIPSQEFNKNESEVAVLTSPTGLIIRPTLKLEAGVWEKDFPPMTPAPNSLEASEIRRDFLKAQDKVKPRAGRRSDQVTKAVLASISVVSLRLGREYENKEDPKNTVKIMVECARFGD